MKRISFYLVFLISFTVSGQSLEKPIQLDSIIYSANRSEQNLIQVGKTVRIIQNGELQNLSGNSLMEKISQLTAMYVVGTYQNPGQVQSIYNRAAGSNQSNVFIDGIRLNNASSTDNIVDYSELSDANIERIEIVNGNQSNMFGSSSIGTTINLITNRCKENGLHGYFKLRYGNFGKKTSLVDQNLNLYYKHNSGIYGAITFFNNQTQGINSTVDTITDVNHFKYQNSDRDNFLKKEQWYKVGIDNDRWNAFVQYRKNFQKVDLDKGAFRDDDNSFSDSRRDHANLNVKFLINSRLSVNLLSGYSRLNYHFRDDSSVVSVSGLTDHNNVNARYHSNTFSTDLLLTHHSKFSRNTVGLSYNKDAMSFNNYYYSADPFFGVFELNTILDSSIYSLRNYSVFLNSEINLKQFFRNMSKWNFNFGLRNTNNSAFGNFWTFELNPYYRLNSRTIVFANYSNAFVSPSIYQLYSPDQSAFNGITRGNSSLVPESSRSIELGFRSHPTKSLNFSGSLFYNQTKNSIDFVYLWSSDIPISQLGFLDYKGDRYLNIGRRESFGIDGSIYFQLLKGLDFTLNYQLISGKNKFNLVNIDTSTIGNNQVQLYNSGQFITSENSSSNLARRPSTLNFKCSYEINSKLQGNILLRWIGKRNDIFYDDKLGPFGALALTRLGRISLLDFNVSYKLTENVLIQYKMENIFNLKYSDIIGYANRGRSNYLQVAARF
ncbi:MAG: TonB-dependent receptor [Saprospiraceae bacterium]|nr:TonB-dependent receptor [Saprospiraceae bacterium]